MNISMGKKQGRASARGLGAVFGSIRIGIRLTFAFVVVLALLVAAVFMGLRGLNEVYTAAQGAFAQNVQVSRHASEITILALNERRFEKDMFINVADPAKVDSYKQKWVAASASMEKEIAAVRGMTLSAEDKAAVEQIAEGHRVYAAGVLSVAGRLGTSIRTTQDANAAMGEFKSAVHGLEEGSKALNDRAVSGVEGIDETLAATQKKTSESQWTLAAVSLALGLLFCVLITRSITRPLRNALDVSRAIAAGRFDNQIDARSKDETGELLASLGVMQERLLESELNAKGQLAMIGQMQAVAEYSPDGRLQQANANFQRIMGYSLDAMVGQQHSRFVDGGTQASGDYQKFWQRLQQGHAEAG
jgi:methyl-accepting chemotaxis protein